MIIAQLPFADIVQNFQDIGEKTGFNGPQFIAQCVAVTILFLFLHKFAWKPVRTMLEERRKIIARIDDQRGQDQEAAGRRRSDPAEHHPEGQRAGQPDHRRGARRAPPAVTEQRAKEATRQAEDIIKNAHEAAVLDRNRLMAELKSQIGALVIQTTEKVAGKVLTADDQARLNSETLRQLEAAPVTNLRNRLHPDENRPPIPPERQEVLPRLPCNPDGSLNEQTVRETRPAPRRRKSPAITWPSSPACNSSSSSSIEERTVRVESATPLADRGAAHLRRARSTASARPPALITRQTPPSSAASASGAATTSGTAPLSGRLAASNKPFPNYPIHSP